MYDGSRLPKLGLLAALPFLLAACAGEPTGLQDPTGGAGGLEIPSPGSGDDGEAGSPESSGQEGSEDIGSDRDGGQGGDEPLEPVADASAGFARIAFAQSGDVDRALRADAASRILASVASGKLAGVSEEQIESIQFALTAVQLHRLGAPKEGEESDGEEPASEGETAADGTEAPAAGEEPGAEDEEPAAEEGEQGGVSGASWVTVELAEGTTLVIDLTELPPEPAEGEAASNGSGLEIAAGELPGGTYKNVRLLGEATITFSEDLTVGSTEYVAGEPYPLDIPSSQSSGVKVKTPKFDIGEGGAASVTIVFDGAESIKKIKLKSGGARMVPVMRASVEVGTAEIPETPEAPESSTP